MKRVYNKETRNDENEYYRNDDWGCDVPDDFSKDNFTETAPPAAAFKGIACDWDADEEEWVLETPNDAVRLTRKEAYQEAWTQDDLEEALLENAGGDATKLNALLALRNTIRTNNPLS